MKGFQSLLVVTQKNLAFYSLKTFQPIHTVALEESQSESGGDFASCCQGKWKDCDYLVVATTKGRIDLYDVDQQRLSKSFKLPIKGHLEAIAFLVCAGKPFVFVESEQSKWRTTVGLWDPTESLQKPLWFHSDSWGAGGVLQLFQSAEGFPVLNRIDKKFTTDEFDWDHIV